MRFTWLHVSQQGWLWPNLEAEFYRDSEEVMGRSGKIDAICFTGDLVKCGSATQFREVSEVLSRLYARLNALGSNPVLFTATDNHDLQRPLLLKRLRKP